MTKSEVIYFSKYDPQASDLGNLNSRYQVEEDIIYWMTTLKNTEGLIVEGAGAITVAAINREKEKWKNKKVCALVCGGNAFF